MPRKIDDPNNNFILLFSQEYSDFVGREKELEVLKRFTENEKLFSWTYVTGQGGVGKSRLLLEICKQLQKKDWVTWFSNDITELVKRHDYFDYNLLIVLDDYTINSNELFGIVQGISNKTKRNKVRLIFINRMKPEHYDNLKKTNPYFQENLFEDELLEIKGFPKLDFLNFVKSIVLKKNDKIDVSWIKNNELEHIESYSRPIFGILLGLAIAEEKNISNWVESDILEYFYKREYIRLQKYFNEEKILLDKHLNLIAILFICKSPVNEDIKKLLKLGKDWLPEPYKFQQQFLSNFLITDNKSNQWISLYPDIISIYFVLQRLSNIDENILYGFEEIKSILSFIDKEINISFGGPSYLKLRIIEDFPESEVGVKILTNWDENDFLSKNLINVYTWSIVEIVKDTKFNDFKKIPSYENIFNNLLQTDTIFSQIELHFIMFKRHLIFKNYEVDKNYLYLKNSTDRYKENIGEQRWFFPSFEDNFDVRPPKTYLPLITNVAFVEEDIPYLEALSISNILIKKLEIKRSKKTLFNRLETLSVEWNDPRIKKEFLLTIIHSDLIKDKKETLVYIINLLNRLVQSSEFQPTQMETIIRVNVIIVDCIFIVIHYLINNKDFSTLERVFTIGLNFIFSLNKYIERHRKTINYFIYKTDRELIDVLRKQGRLDISSKYLISNISLRNYMNY
ncbi:ATP-binding protein [Emticicia agri]|uniref:ATP-binding protein n=1 Tax=Emticicia agri TaxID=2492393 RepID=A0A4Q5LSM1_9BACT|nr:ATP-binding protein [Emticicia agri]RYU92596.1 ATP-binding protein [Emticicia agri]